MSARSAMAELQNAETHAECITCRRPVPTVSRRASTRVMVDGSTRVPALPEPDFCTWCGKAITERADALEAAFARRGQREDIAWPPPDQKRSRAPVSD